MNWLDKKTATGLFCLPTRICFGFGHFWRTLPIYAHLCPDFCLFEWLVFFLRVHSNSFLRCYFLWYSIFVTNQFIFTYSIVRTFVTSPFPTENPGKPWKSLINSDFELEKSGKKRKLWCLLGKSRNQYIQTALLITCYAFLRTLNLFCY